jgi:hypothetical protein
MTVGGPSHLVSKALITAPGTTKARSIADRFKDAPSVLDYGAVCDGVTDDTAAVRAAMAAASAGGFRLSIPRGRICNCPTLSQASISASFVGPGQIKTSDGNLRAPIVNQITAAPSAFGDNASVLTAFNGDLTKQPFAIEHRITGAATAGQPATGYVIRDELSPYHIYLYNESGWNQSTSGNGGRTGIGGIRFQGYNTGQGDVCLLWTSMLVSGAKPGATSFLAPAASPLPE